MPAPARPQARLAAAFFGAAALSIALAVVPYGRYALYPFALLATWAHEMGHGLAALLVGGSFSHLELYPDLGGVAYSRHGGGLRGVVVSAGGLLGPALLGGLVVVLGARQATARRVLLGLGLALVASLVLWVRNPFGMVSVAALAAATLALARWGAETPRLVVTQLIGIQLCLGSLASFDYMFTKGFERGGKLMASDTQAIAEVLLLPYWVWGALIAGLSLLILAGAFWLAWVRPSRPAA
ncbi:MAG: M50 family metallopeptidase [Planctomycetes bacterium]|nr:M50 family metallopeptidase [Planctomycetota bacterium]